MTATILYVEDDEGLLNSLKRRMESKLKLNVISAENGEVALQKLEENKDKIQLILSDVKMPVMDGVDFFKSVQQTPQKNLPFIFLTGHTTLDDIGDLKGFSQIPQLLNKPISSNDLIEALQKALNL
jgi:CheY-like chemotaxis protein